MLSSWLVVQAGGSGGSAPLAVMDDFEIAAVDEGVAPAGLDSFFCSGA